MFRGARCRQRLTCCLVYLDVTSMLPRSQSWSYQGYHHHISLIKWLRESVVTYWIFIMLPSRSKNERIMHMRADSGSMDSDGWVTRVTAQGLWPINLRITILLVHSFCHKRDWAKCFQWKWEVKCTCTTAWVTWVTWSHGSHGPNDPLSSVSYVTRNVFILFHQTLVAINTQTHTYIYTNTHKYTHAIIYTHIRPSTWRSRHTI